MDWEAQPVQPQQGDAVRNHVQTAQNGRIERIEADILKRAMAANPEQYTDMALSDSDSSDDEPAPTATLYRRWALPPRGARCAAS